MFRLDLHRHLEGSLRVDTLRDIARQYNLPLPEGFPDAVQVQPGDARTSVNFLHKFHALRPFYRSPEVIARVTREAVEDAARDGLGYLELRFTPAALIQQQGYTAGEVIDWVSQAAAQASADFRLPTRLIISLNRHETVAQAETVASAAALRANPDADGGVVGLDLAGNEAEFSGRDFAGLFREARQSGLRLTVHAGEWLGGESVREAIETLGAERIGHGVRILENVTYDELSGGLPSVVELARERGVTLEVCLTSNYLSGVVNRLANHPLPKLLAAGLHVSLNTDDPAICRTTLSEEYRRAVEEVGISQAELERCVQTAIHASFLPEERKRELEKQAK